VRKALVVGFREIIFAVIDDVRNGCFPKSLEVSRLPLTLGGFGLCGCTLRWVCGLVGPVLGCLRRWSLAVQGVIMLHG
jgi:hypothetical protein